MKTCLIVDDSRVVRKVAAAGLELEQSLRELKGHDPSFMFLKPHHPLHAYYAALRQLPAPHLVGSVARASQNEPASHSTHSVRLCA